jgi:SAM-dependent methyltransferase
MSDPQFATDAAVSRQFDEGYRAWKSWSDDNFGHCDSASASYFAAELRFSGVAEGNLRILEIGFGNGAFLRFARDAGHDVVGLEVIDGLRNAARNAGYGVLDSLEQAAPESFDLICAFDVLEHVPQDALPALLLEIRRALRPGGRFLARFPNGDSPFGRAFQHGDLTHVTPLGSGKVEALAGMVGLQLISCGHGALPLDKLPLKKKILRLGAHAVKAMIERLVGALYFHRRVCLEPNLVVVMQRPAAQG